MLREAKNQVKISGILSENNLELSSYTNNQGQTMDCIRGNIKVRVKDEINGVPVISEIPVHVFANKLTKAGTESKTYKNLVDAMNLVSIAACGNEEQADKIRITTARISMNAFISNNGTIVNQPRITTSLIYKVTGDIKHSATFEIEAFLQNFDVAYNKDGTECDPRKLKLTTVVPKYNGLVDVVDLVAINPNAVDFIENNWTPGSTYACYGKISFTSKVETSLQELDFGEPIEKSYTSYVNEFVLTGGSEPLMDNMAFEPSAVNQALALRTQELQSKQQQTKVAKTPAPTSSNLGF